MFKGYGKVNSILHEKLNSVQEIKNISSSDTIQKIQEKNILDLEKLKNKKKTQSFIKNRNYGNNDLLNDNYTNFEEKERSMVLNKENSSSQIINDNYIDIKNNYDILANNYDGNYKIEKIDIKNLNPKISKTSKKIINKKKKSEFDLLNPLQLDVDHFPSYNYITVKMKDQVTDMPGDSKSQIFLTQKKSENDLKDKKKKLKYLKNNEIKRYISDISEVNQIKFFAFEVKNPGHKEHFNNKIFQIEKEILKEIDQINKEQNNNFNSQLENTENFFDLDESKVFNFTKNERSLSNPHFYGRPISKQNFKTNPGLIRGFLKNFKNNKLLNEFFKYKRERDKRERFNLQSNVFSATTNEFRKTNTNSNTDYIETYYIGKNLKEPIKNATLTKNDFLKKNDVDKMKKYYETLKQQRNNEDKELHNLNNLNQDLYINKEFIKEFNEYANKFSKGQISSEQIPSINHDMDYQIKNFFQSNNEFSEIKNIINNDLKQSLHDIHKIDEINENNEYQSISNKDPMDNLVSQIFHSNNSQKSNISPKAELTPGSPPNFQFNSFRKPKSNNLDKCSEKINQKYLEDNFYEEPIDDNEAVKVISKMNDHKINNIDSFTKEKDKAYSRELSNSDKPNNIDPKNKKKLKILSDIDIIGKNMNNQNIYKTLINKDTLDLEDSDKLDQIEIKSKNILKLKYKNNDRDYLDSNELLYSNNLKYLVIKENTNEKNMLTNSNKDIKIITNENPTDILQSGISYEEYNKYSNHENADGLFNNDEINVETKYYDNNSKQLKSKAISPPSFLRTNFHGKNLNNSIYENFQKMNIKNYSANSIPGGYYKPISNNISKNNFRNVKKNKFEKLKDIVFGHENGEHKQKMIKNNNSKSNNISTNMIFSKKPTTAPTINKSKSPLRNLINNQMGLIIKNQNIY